MKKIIQITGICINDDPRLQNKLNKAPAEEHSKSCSLEIHDNEELKEEVCENHNLIILQTKEIQKCKRRRQS